MRYLARQIWLRWLLVFVMTLPMSLLISNSREGALVAQDAKCDPGPPGGGGEVPGNPPEVPPGPCTVEGGLGSSDSGGPGPGDPG